MTMDIEAFLQDQEETPRRKTKRPIISTWGIFWFMFFLTIILTN